MIRTKKVLKRRLKMLTKRYLILVGWLKRLITTQKLQRLKTKYLVLLHSHSRDKTKFIELCLFFSMWVFFHEHSQITGLHRKRKGISLSLHYHFHSLLRHLDISQAITMESSPLHIVNSWTWPRNLQFMGASH